MSSPFKLGAFAAAFSLTLLPTTAFAGVFGFLGNFDVINDTGQTAHGFEIDLDGLDPTDITDTFGGAGRGFPSGRGFDPNTAVERYGSPTIASYNHNGVIGTSVTYLGLWDNTNSIWDFGTPSGTFITPGDNCWTGGGLGYGSSTPCDHFGVGTTKNATNTHYNWLLETNTPGTLTNGSVTLPAPTWTVSPAPPPAPGQQPAPPQVIAKIQSPEPDVPEIDGEAQWGDAIWVKVFTTELENDVKLEDLIGGNDAINAAKQHTETEWQLLQYDPGNPLSAVLESGYGAPVGPNAASIIRRYEFYKFGGEYDAKDHHALVFSDSLPQGGELGNYLGAQNAAANLQIVAPPVPLPPAFLFMGTGLLVLLRNHWSKAGFNKVI
ncbi:hypothetical protein ACH50O_23450 (plasmid) [Methylomonas sp. 2BW1-5-20]|uniref:hypothetical protein n=1 Tax=Methylomonas sp. 2BW1-5-20 TaxID=3376686 RepID=UPI00404CFB57